MSFKPRAYEKIVEDMLTTLTGGTVRETVDLLQESDALVLNKLRNRPVQRVSHLEAYFKDENGDTFSHRYASGDFELVNSEGGKDQPDRIRILEGARPAQRGDQFQVNYYPSQTAPIPLTDIQTGSVTRTMIETFAREMAVTHLHMDHVYKSAFLETASGKSLERVVALLGLRRFPGGFPLVKLRFFRAANTPGQITIPAGSSVTDADGSRFRTLTALTLEPYESSRDALAAGDSKSTPIVAANTLIFPETVIAGIESVTNPDPAYQIAAPETDPDLKDRARQAMLAGVGGTMEALIGGVRAIEGVKTVTYTEHPNGLPGEVRLDIVYGQDTEEVKSAVKKRIDTLRPAGIRVLINDDTKEKPLRLSIELTLAGDGVVGSELETLKTTIKEALVEHFENLEPKSKVRQAQLALLLLKDPRVVDGQVVIQDAAEQPLSNPSLHADEVFKVLDAQFSKVEAENGTSTLASLKVGAHLPGILETGFGISEIEGALTSAFDQYLKTASVQGHISVQNLLQALRDDQRYALISSDIIITIETQDQQFFQLGEGQGEHSFTANQPLIKGQLSFDLQGSDA